MKSKIEELEKEIEEKNRKIQEKIDYIKSQGFKIFPEEYPDTYQVLFPYFYKKIKHHQFAILLYILGGFLFPKKLYEAYCSHEEPFVYYTIRKKIYNSDGIAFGCQIKITALSLLFGNIEEIKCLISHLEQKLEQKLQEMEKQT